MRKRMIDKVVKILEKAEPNLSDGYGHYCDPVGERLREIATEIVDTIEKEYERNNG